MTEFKLPVHYSNWGSDKDKVLSQMLKDIQWLVDRGYKVTRTYMGKRKVANHFWDYRDPTSIKVFDGWESILTVRAPAGTPKNEVEFSLGLQSCYYSGEE